MVLDVAEKVLTLVKSVSILEEDVKRLTHLVEEVREKLIRMESTVDIAREESKRVAAEQVAGMMADFGSRFEFLQHEVKKLSGPAG